MAYTDTFLRKISAYKLELGAAFPSADPKSVLMILRECNAPDPKTQKEIGQATRLSQTNVSKLIAKMIDREWLERSQRDAETSVKKVQITLRGAGLLIAFEQACRGAAKNIPKTTTPNE